jgi:hypothetical protein
MIASPLELLAAFTAPRWAWTTTAVIGAVVTLSLIGILSAHVFLAATWHTVPNRRGQGLTAIQRRLTPAVVPLLVLLLVVILVRFGLVLAERPGR